MKRIFFMKFLQSSSLHEIDDEDPIGPFAGGWRELFRLGCSEGSNGGHEASSRVEPGRPGVLELKFRKGNGDRFRLRQINQGVSVSASRPEEISPLPDFRRDQTLVGHPT